MVADRETPTELLPTVALLCQRQIALDFAGVELGLAARAVAQVAGMAVERVLAGARDTGTATTPTRPGAALAKVLGTRSVDAGGWLIFALPPAELAVHPASEGGRAELYLLCDDSYGLAPTIPCGLTR